MNTQDNFQAALVTLAPSLKLDLITDHDFANNGAFRFHRPESFTDLLTVRFDFQTDYVTFNIEAVAKKIRIFAEFGRVPGELDKALNEIKQLVTAANDRKTVA